MLAGCPPEKRKLLPEIIKVVNKKLLKCAKADSLKREPVFVFCC